MNSEYICPKLKKIIETCYGIGKGTPYYQGSYARETEDGLYTFGTRKPMTRNTVTKRIALYLITSKIPELEEETFNRTKK